MNEMTEREKAEHNAFEYAAELVKEYRKENGRLKHAICCLSVIIAVLLFTLIVFGWCLSCG